MPDVFRTLCLTLVLLACAGCDFSSLVPGANEKFGDQHFKSAVAAIELHRVREGNYPAELSDLEYLGDWDQIWLTAVDYDRVDGGYNLFVVRGWMGEPELELPEAYRHGLGIRETNVTWVTGE